MPMKARSVRRPAASGAPPAHRPDPLTPVKQFDDFRFELPAKFDSKYL
jgi:hypothetical protein